MTPSARKAPNYVHTASAVIGARAGSAVVAASRLDAGGVKFGDGGVIGRAECDVAARGGRPVVQVKPQRRLALGSEARAGLVARTQRISERRQHGGIEPHAGVEVADFQSDMVVHGGLLLRRAAMRAVRRRP